jgi:hypothetical protein
MPRALLLLLLAPAAAPAATTSFDLTLSAGKHDRKDEPVCVHLTLPKDFAPRAYATLTDGKANTYAWGQVTTPGLLSPSAAPAGKVARDLHFVLRELKAGATLRLKATISTEEPPRPDVHIPQFHWVEEKGKWSELRFDKTPVLRYVCEPLDDSTPARRELTFKVYHHAYSPDGKRLLTKGPGGKYTHHRGLFYGFMKTSYAKEKVDIWHCKGDTHQAHDKTLSTEAGLVLGRHTVRINWNGKGKKTFAVEDRELTAYRLPGGTLIGFASVLRPADGPVKLDGDPQHAGFHFRADNEVAAKTSKQTIFVRPDGTGKPGTERNWDGKKNKTHVNLPWLAMSFVLGGQRYTAAYLDRPANPKEARFSERTYGRFGSYFVTEATKDRPLRVAYRVWLQEGLMTPKEVQAKDTAFVSPVGVTVK